MSNREDHKRTYASWCSMTCRCRGGTDNYRFYGARGISVCDRWLGRCGFANFLADMGERPQGKTLDRINNDGNYEPGNCRWATQKIQVQNCRHTKLTIAQANEIRTRMANGEHAIDLAAEYGVRAKTIRNAATATHWSNADIAPVAISGRRALGDRHGQAKLSAEIVLSIRREALLGCSYRDMGRRHGVHAGTIRNVVLGVTWGHVLTPPSECGCGGWGVYPRCAGCGSVVRATSDELEGQVLDQIDQALQRVEAARTAAARLLAYRLATIRRTP